jgi:dipeptidyl aminopeptidase/acylaminoacyl peptidase
MGGGPAEVPERYRRSSPLTYAAQARTPTLLVYGAESGFSRHHQGERFRDALAAAGVEVELVHLPGEGHFFARPQSQAALLRHTLTWFDRHLHHPPP